MKHIVFYSGGLGSWATAKRLVERYGKEDVILLFTDTLIEDEDLYRFLIESTSEMYGIKQSEILELVEHIPKVSKETMEERKEYLTKLSELARKRNGNFIWINDGRDPWDVFKQTRFLGNSRLAKCSHELKQDMSAKYLRKHYEPEQCRLYLGIDWTEKHRTAAPIRNWKPYTVDFPMCEEPFLTKIDHIKELEKLNIQTPKLYNLDFSHNNCGGFCVRAGQGHFVNLLNKLPDLYKYHEEKEQEMIDFLDRDVSILTRTRKGVKQNLTLRQLREEYKKEPKQIDMFDIGGCGCFVDDETIKGVSE